MAKDQVLVEFRLDTDAARDDANAIIKDGDRIVESYKKAADTISKDLTDALKLIASKSGEIIDVDAVVNDVEKLKKLLASLNDSAAGMSKGSKEYTALQQVIQGVSSQIEVLDKGVVKMGLDSVKAAKSLKAQYKEAENAANVAISKFGAFSKQAAEATKKAAELKDQLGFTKDQINAMNPDAKFNALTKSIQGVVFGVQAYQGAIGLMGLDSENALEAIRKLNNIMALTSGLQGLLEAKDSLKTLGAVALDTFRSIRTGVLLTGIGAFAVSVGLIYTYWDQIKEAVTGVSRETRELAAAAEKDLKSSEDKLKNLDKQDAILKLQGYSEETIARIKLANYKAEARQQILALEAIYKKEEETINSNLRIAKALSKVGLSAVGTFFYSEEDKKALENAKAALKEKKDILKNGEAEYTLDLRDAITKREKEAKDSADKQASENEKAKQKELARIAEIAKANAEFFKDRGKNSGEYTTQADDDARLRREEVAKQNRIKSKEEERQTNLKADKEIDDELEKRAEARDKKSNDAFKKEMDKRKQLLLDQVKAVDDLAKRGLLLTIGIQPQSYDAMKAALQALDKDSGLSDPQKWAAFASAGQSVYSDISNFIRQKDKEDLQIELNNLNSQKEEELALAEGNEQKKAVILQKYKQKERELKRKDAEADKRKAIFDAIIGTAAAVVAAGIVTPQAILAGILGAAQVAFISAQPIPKFAKGVHRLQGRGTQTSDEIPAMLSKDESVVPAANSIKFSPLVESLVNGNPDDLIRKNYVLPALKAQEKQYQAALANKRDETIARTIAKAMSDTRANDNKNTERIVKALDKADILA